MRGRKLPPLAKDEDRIEAARLIASELWANISLSERIKAAWNETMQEWNHFQDSSGGIISERAA
jgi:hypothetical protein